MYDYATSSLQRQELSILQDIQETNEAILQTNTSIALALDMILFVVCIKFVISIVRDCL